MSNNIYDILNKLNSVAGTTSGQLNEGKEYKTKDDFDDYAKSGDWYQSAQGKVTKTDKGIKHERGAPKDTEELDEAREFSSRSEFDERAQPGDWCKTAHGKLIKTATGVRHERGAAKDTEELDEGREFKNKDEFDASAKPGDYYHTSKGKVTKTDKGVKHERSDSKDDNREELDESSDEAKLQQYHDMINRGMDPDDAEVDVFNDEGDDAELDEVAPPGEKAERMVKHIKKGYADDGKLTKKEKGIAYATAWKAHNKGQVEEGVEFGDTIKNSKADLKKVKKQKVTEGAIRNHPIYTTQEAWDHYAKELAEQETMEGMGDFMHEPGIPSPTAAQPVTKAVDTELAEIARLAGLPEKDDNDIPPPPPHEDPIVLETEDLDEEEMEEGNEFSGALAKAKAAGAKEFEVDGKKYTVKEDVNLTADTVDDVVGLLRKLAGLEAAETETETEVAPADFEFDAAYDDGMMEERDIEYINTPREKVAPLAAATPNGTDMHRAKKSYSDKPYHGDNPMAVQESVEDKLWKSYSSMLQGLKK